MNRIVWRPSLRSRILAWSFIPTTIILLAIVTLVFYAYQRLALDLAVGRNEALTQRAAERLSSSLNLYADRLVEAARATDIYSTDPGRQSAALQLAGNRMVWFDGGLAILGPSGRVAQVWPERSAWVGQNWSGQGLSQPLGAAASPTFRGLLPASSEVVGIAVPIVDAQGDVRGSLVGLLRVVAGSENALQSEIADLPIGQTGNAYLVDSTGRVIYHSAGMGIGDDLHTLPAVQQVLAGQSGYLGTQDLDRRSVLATFAPVPGTPWGLVSEQPWSDLVAPIQGYGQSLLVLLALGVILPALVVTIGAKRLTDPIRRLIIAAQEIAGGQFGQQITVHTGDELEELVGQFNQMSKALAESYAELKQAHQVLETRVAERTRELVVLNEIAAVVSRSLDLQEILNAALNKAMDTMHMEAGTAYSLADGDGPDEEKALLLAASRGLSPEFSERVGRRPVRGTSIQQAAQAGKPLVWLVAQHPDPLVKHALEMEGVRQVINVPLIAKRRFVGAFNLGTRHEREIAPEELLLLSSIGRQVALAVENARLYDQAEQTAALAERHRLSRELHDSVTQSLYSVTMYAEAATRSLASGSPGIAAGHLRELRDTAQEALREMRLLIFELRPPTLEKTGLAAALRARLDSVEARGGLQAELVVDGLANAERLSRQAEDELYHIAQEALNNVLKHSHAGRVRVHLHFGEAETVLEICDDGVGFATSIAGDCGGMGLASLRERASKIRARLAIQSAPGSGTEVRVVVPGGSAKDLETLRST